MKVIYFLFLLLFVATVVVFAVQNTHPETVTFLNQSWETTFPILVGSAYLLGMLTGWTVVGLVRRSWQRAVEDGR